MSILVLNAGSSSLKLSLFDAEANDLLASLSDEKESDFPQVLARLPTLKPAEIRVVGHRFVHGGGKFTEPVLITKEVAGALKEISELAPLHNPPALKAFEAAKALFGRALHVAVFDTAFFSDLPERAFIYPVPYEWFTQWGIRRYGFHGISHEYCARHPLARDASRLIILHLGSGCSASAILDGKPIATTMGLTPLEGLMMATRSGSIDPGILLHLMKNRGLSVEQLEQALNKSSGLLGVSGISSDYRDLEKAAAAGNARAKLAFDLYADSIVSAIGSYTALLGGLDTLIFTAGVGEHRHSLRASVCDRLSWLGIHLDPQRNATCIPDMDIARPESRVRVLVIHAREDLMIAQAAHHCLRADNAQEKISFEQ